jgi:hypothetical protein
MGKVHNGRYTAEIDGDFVVFVIGMRFNRLWKVHQWWPVFTAMPKMLKVLATNPSKGFLGGRTMLGGRTITMIQYWRSFEDLERFARDSGDPHLEPWRRFNRKVGKSGDVGIFHETYKVPAGSYECIYGNMPVIGLAAAGRHLAVGPRAEAARQRIEAAAEAAA